MENLERKEIAKKYYSSISNNKILGCRMSPTSKGDVCLRVFNQTFKTEGTVTIGVRPKFNELLLCADGGVYGSSQISKFK